MKGEIKAEEVPAKAGQCDDSDCDHDHEDNEAKVEEFIKSLPQEAQDTVKVLQELQQKTEDLNTQFLAEKKALELKYEQLNKPIFAERTEVIKTDKIEKFWLTAMKNNPMIADSIEEADEEALAALLDIQNDTTEKGFTLTFTFKPNAYFSDTVLTKKYTFVEEDGELIFEKAEGTQINWSAGKNLTVKLITKKQRHKSGRGTRTVTRPEPTDSFFNFFNPPQIDDENEDSDENGDIEQLIEADFELGEEFRERLVPRAVDWFTGAAVDLDDYMMDDEDMDGDDDDEDDDEEGDSEEEEEKPKKGGKKGGKGGKGGDFAAPQFQMPGGQQPQCEKGQQ